MKKVIERCIKEAGEMECEYIGTEHVLMALLASDGMASRFLQDNGVTREGFLEAWNEWNKGGSQLRQERDAAVTTIQRMIFIALEGVSWTSDEEVYDKIRLFTDDLKKLDSINSAISEYRRDILNQVEKSRELVEKIGRILTAP